MIIEYLLWSYGVNPTSLYGYGFIPSFVYREVINWVYLISDGMFKFFLVIAMIISLAFLLIALFSLLYRYKHKEEKFILEKAPFVTIQIPTRNELAAINCENRCLDFDYPKGKFNIIIGDDSNKPEISAQLEDFASVHKGIVKIMRRAQNIGYKPGNLNNMLKGTNGEIIVIFDSDFLPPKDFLRRIVTPFIYDKNLAACQARWVPYNANKNLTTALGTGITEVFHQIFLPFMSWATTSVCFCGSAEAVRKSKLNELGEWKSGCLTEDIEYSMRLYKSGNRVAYLHNLTCECEVPQTPMDLYRQQMRWAYGVIGSIREHFWDIMKADVPFMLKTNVFFLGMGYVLTVVLFMLLIFGSISFFTHPPGPIDIPLFIQETLLNIAFTSGLIFTFFIAMVKSKRFLRIPAVVAAAFSIGFVVTYYANKGIYRVLTNGEMEWFLVKKDGNVIAQKV